MAVALDRPDNEEEIYHARGEELSSARPLLTGDVLEGIELPGQEHSTAMLIAHPCTMRRGVELVPKLVCAPVTDYQQVSPEQWQNGFGRVFPLSGFGEGDHRAALLDQLVALDSSVDWVDARIACLEQVGIFLLQQRLIHSLARCKVTLSTIRHSMEHVLVEAELQEDWVEDLAEFTDPDARAEATQAFDLFLTENDLRTQLADSNRRSQAISRVAREITKRRDPALDT